MESAPTRRSTTCSRCSRMMVSVMSLLKTELTSFMVLYNRDNVESIGLDEAAKCLSVERRRIYDIVNVLEGVGNFISALHILLSWINPQSFLSFAYLIPSIFYDIVALLLVIFLSNPIVDVDIPDQTWDLVSQLHWYFTDFATCLSNQEQITISTPLMPKPTAV
ncbi:hypothetical protein ACJX0J_036360 [Zea mays]